MCYFGFMYLHMMHLKPLIDRLIVAVLVGKTNKTVTKWNNYRPSIATCDNVPKCNLEFV